MWSGECFLHVQVKREPSEVTAGHRLLGSEVTEGYRAVSRGDRQYISLPGALGRQQVGALIRNDSS